MSEHTGDRLSRRRVSQALIGGAIIAGFNPLTRAWSTGAFDGSHMPRLPKLDGQLFTDAVTRDAYAQDYGQILHEQPLAVLKPGSVRDIRKMVRFARRHGVRIAVRGHGHQPFGQAQIQGGIVIDMSTLHAVRSVTADTIDVDAGAQWRAVLESSLPYGVAPPVLTNTWG